MRSMQRIREVFSYNAVSDITPCDLRQRFATFTLSMAFHYISIVFSFGLGYCCPYIEGKALFGHTVPEAISSILQKTFEISEKYSYVKSRSRGTAFYYFCSQRKHHRKNTEGRSQKRIRTSTSKRSHFCGGSLSISMQKY